MYDHKPCLRPQTVSQQPSRQPSNWSCQNICALFQNASRKQIWAGSFINVDAFSKFCRPIATESSNTMATEPWVRRSVVPVVCLVACISKRKHRRANSLCLLRLSPTHLARVTAYAGCRRRLVEQFAVHSPPLFRRARQRQQLSADALLVVGKLLCDDAATFARTLRELRRAKRQTFLIDRFFCRLCEPRMVFVCECNGSPRYMCFNHQHLAHKFICQRVTIFYVKNLIPTCVCNRLSQCLPPCFWSIPNYTLEWHRC